MAPVWSRDGKRIAYYSNRNGKYQIYFINPDGSGMRQVTETDKPGGAVLPIWSPNGSQMAFSLLGDRSFIMDLNKAWNDQSPIATPSPENASHFVADAWSPDGKYLVGRMYYANVPRGLVAYSLEMRTYETISESGSNARWLSDSRRLVFITGDKLYLTDMQSRKPRELYSFSPKILTGIDISQDNRSIYVSVASTEADIWLLRL